MNQHNQRKNTTSRISLVKILFEEDGGGSDYSTPSDVGDLRMNYGGSGYGSSYGGVSDFKKTFIDPFKTLFQAFGYGTEKISNAVFYFTKKILANIPRLFNPATPLIFDDIKDEEKAAYQRLDARYADMLKQVQENVNNKDLKAIAFLLYPKQILSAAFVVKAPKIAYKTINTLSGNKLSDLVSRVKQEYNSLPSQQRSKQRVAALVNKYKQEDAKEAERKKTGKSSIPDSPSGSYGYGYGYDNYDYITEKKQLSNQELFSLYPDIFTSAIESSPELQNAMDQIEQSGEEAMRNILDATKEKVSTLEQVINSTDVEKYAKAVGLSSQVINNLIEKNINETLRKLETESRKSDKPVVELPQEEKEQIKEEVKKQILDQLLLQAKENYAKPLKAAQQQLNLFLSNTIPQEDLRKESQELLGRINNLLRKA